MDKVDITKLSLVELKALVYDQQQELAVVRESLKVIMMQIQKKEKEKK